MTESGATMSKWDPEERRMVGDWVAETIWRKRDDIGLQKTIEEQTISTAWYLMKKSPNQTARRDIQRVILAGVGVLVDIRAPAHQIAIDQVTSIEDREGQGIIENLVGAVAALITSIATRTRMLDAIVDILSLY